MRNYELSLFADYYQFYFQDDDPAFGDLSEAWTDEAVDILLAVSDHVIGVGTVRNMDVPVHVSVQTVLPDLESPEWDRLNRASLRVDTGRIVFAGCTDYLPDAFRVEVEPGDYDVLVAYKNLEDVSEDGLEGRDSYHVFLARTKG
jgi:hypothetical protein